MVQIFQLPMQKYLNLEVIILNFDWTAEVVGRMHMSAITGKQLAEEAGMTNSYLSTVLHGKKGNAATRQRITNALERLEQCQAHN